MENSGNQRKVKQTIKERKKERERERERGKRRKKEEFFVRVSVYMCVF